MEIPGSALRIERGTADRYVKSGSKKTKERRFDNCDPGGAVSRAPCDLITYGDLARRAKMAGSSRQVEGSCVMSRCRAKFSRPERLIEIGRGPTTRHNHQNFGHGLSGGGGGHEPCQGNSRYVTDSGCREGRAQAFCDTDSFHYRRHRCGCRCRAFDLLSLSVLV